MESAKELLFKELDAKEKLSSFMHLAQLAPPLVVSAKGQDSRQKVTSYQIEGLNLQLSVPHPQQNQQYLFSYQRGSVSYFGELSYESDQSFSCQRLFKLERRQNYRLLTYPHHKVYFTFTNLEENGEAQKIVDIKRKENEVFKDFLELVDKSEAFKFRVMNFSVSGMALLCSPSGKELIEKSAGSLRGALKVAKETIEIPGCKLVHVNPVSDNLEYSFKLGMEFENLNLKIDHEIGYAINKFLRDDNDFEDFIS